MENNHYDTSKYNAVKHGVLSKEAVLDWESQDDYNSLLVAFEEEYLPQGITEAYLVTELAQIIWRKRRLRMAEKAMVKFNLKMCGDNTINRAIYGHSIIRKVGGRVEDAFRGTEQEAQEEIKELQKAFTHYKKILDKDYTYEEYLHHIDDDLKSNWHEWLDDKTSYYNKDVESFKRFIQKVYLDFYQEQLNPLLVRDAIKYEAICEAVEPTKKYDNLSRYESHLDRKFEKTLGMIVKLQELRGQPASESIKAV